MPRPLYEDLASVLAHAGHGHTDPDSILHILAEPLHAGLLAAPLGIGAALIIARIRRRARTVAKLRDDAGPTS